MSPVSQPRLVQPLLLLLVFLSVCDASTPWGRHTYINRHRILLSEVDLVEAEPSGRGCPFL